MKICPMCSMIQFDFVEKKNPNVCMVPMCGFEDKVPHSCPSCSADRLSFLGYGTQKLESELEKYLPDMPVMRMDADTTVGKLAYDRMLFAIGEEILTSYGIYEK